MKLSTKIILPIILISALLILLNGCMGTVPDDESPGYTPGTITGIIAAPCCSTSAEPVTETCCIAPEYWCFYCQNTWSLQEGIEVVLTYGEDEVATVFTNKDGEFTFTNVDPGKNYVVTAYCPDFGDNRPLVKDVALELIEGGSFNTKTTDLVSTSLGLVVDFLVLYTDWGPEDISLDAVLADRPNFPNFPKFKKLVYEVRRVVENCEVNLLTDDEVQDALCRAAEEISKLEIGCGPGYTTPPPPPPDPCAGNTAPLLDLKDKEVTAPDTFNYDIPGSGNASDGDGDTLTYSLTSNPTGMTIGSSTGVITWEVDCDDAECLNDKVRDLISQCIPKDYLIEVKVTDACHPDGVVDTFTLTVNPCEYDLTVLVNPSGGGTPSGAGTYTQNSIAAISVAENAGYVFVDWTGDTVLGSTTVNPNSVFMDANKTVTANLRWHEVYEPFCRFAFEDLPITPSTANDWDYNDWVGEVDIDCQYYGADLLEKITFTVTHQNDGAGRNAEVWFKIPADTFSSSGNYVLNGGSSTAFDDTSDNDFQFISSVDGLTVGDEFTLEIEFDTPFSFTCSPFDVTDIYGKGIFFQPYLHVLVTSAYDVPDYLTDATDPRRLAVPGSWTKPNENIAIWDVYTNVNGSSTAGPDFSLEDGTWVLAP